MRHTLRLEVDMGDSERGQVSANAAKIYEKFYLPAYFEEWPPRIIEAARIQRGHHVVDVACGTGVLALAVLERVGPEGFTVGVDNNEGMLNVAIGKAQEIEWKHAAAEALPFDDDSFDSVVSQFGLMYFENKQGALKEMMRVLRPGGNLAVAVWDKLENCPGLAAENQVWQRLFGDEAADNVPYNIGDKQVLQMLFSGADISGAEIQTYEGTARFPSIETWIYAGVKGWAQDDMIDDKQYELLLKEAQKDLSGFVTTDGTVSFSTLAHIVTTSKPDVS